MIVTFEKKYLRDLYEKGKSNDKKYRFQPEIVERYIKCINLMRRVDDTQGLTKYNGLNLKKLRGDKADIFSIRVNKQYRIEFTIEETGMETILTVCNILELSNHYK